ncbi:hypothetical protein DINM_002107 [Dirofilaria immitis]|nr:hypothetical protein [Dirofilaria immitis]
MDGGRRYEYEVANGCNSWLSIFRMFDTNYDGYIATHDLRRFVYNSAASFGLSREEANNLLKNVDKNGDHLLDFAEFCTLLRMRHVLFRAAQMVVPRSSRTIPFNYLQQYNCFPPPITHLAFNVLTQIVLGIPLELVHKFWRIGLVYLSGVLAGSLLDYAIDPRTYLAGASGGVYALLAAHIAELLINWTEMEFALCRAFALAVLISSDISMISHASHLAGFVAGILMGTVVLRNFRKKNWERMIWWIAFVVTGLSFSALVLLNIIPHT